MSEVFPYGEKETSYLKQKDAKLAVIIEQIGMLERPVEDDLFSGLVSSIAGQQISGKAHQAIMRRIKERLGKLEPKEVIKLSAEELRTFGLSFRKAEYILSAAERALAGELDVETLSALPDSEIKERLCSFKGVGEWTAEMLMLFAMKRPDVLSFGDYGIQRGLRMVQRHRKIDRKLFAKYRRRYSPYGSTASLYLWAVASGAIDGLTDPAAKRKKK